jgi:hypothetical protein
MISQSLLLTTYLCKDVEIDKFCGLLFNTKGVSIWRFGDILSSCIFIKYLRASQRQPWKGGGDGGDDLR